MVQEIHEPLGHIRQITTIDYYNLFNYYHNLISIIRIGTKDKEKRTQHAHPYRLFVYITSFTKQQSVVGYIVGISCFETRMSPGVFPISFIVIFQYIRTMQEIFEILKDL
jgi:hypothetical protein